MSQEWAEADDIAGNQTKCQYNQRQSHDENKFQKATVVGLKLQGIFHQETGQEEIMQ